MSIMSTGTRDHMHAHAWVYIHATNLRLALYTIALYWGLVIACRMYTHAHIAYAGWFDCDISPFQGWYEKTPLGKKRAKALKPPDDGGGKGKKGKGKKKKWTSELFVTMYIPMLCIMHYARDYTCVRVPATACWVRIMSWWYDYESSMYENSEHKCTRAWPSVVSRPTHTCLQIQTNKICSKTFSVNPQTCSTWLLLGYYMTVTYPSAPSAH